MGWGVRHIYVKSQPKAAEDTRDFEKLPQKINRPITIQKSCHATVGHTPSSFRHRDQTQPNAGEVK